MKKKNNKKTAIEYIYERDFAYPLYGGYAGTYRYYIRGDLVMCEARHENKMQYTGRNYTYTVGSVSEIVDSYDKPLLREAVMRATGKEDEPKNYIYEDDFRYPLYGQYAGSYRYYISGDMVICDEEHVNQLEYTGDDDTYLVGTVREILNSDDNPRLRRAVKQAVEKKLKEI